MPSPNLALLFDLDGTLIDSATDLQTTCNAILKQEGLPPLDLDKTKACLGDGLRKLLIGVFRLSGRDLNGDDLKRLMPEFEQVYRSITPQVSMIYPGIIDVLQASRARGVRLGLCTNKYEEATLRIVKALRLDEFFSTIVGGDTVSESKPHPLPLQHALKQLEVEPLHAVMVGDHHNDALSARAAGIKSIGVRYGYTKKWPARALPDAFVDSAAEIPGTAAGLVKGF